MRHWFPLVLTMSLAACTLLPTGGVSIRRGGAGVVAISHKSRPPLAPGIEVINQLSGHRTAPAPAASTVSESPSRPHRRRRSPSQCRVRIPVPRRPRRRRARQPGPVAVAEPSRRPHHRRWRDSHRPPTRRHRGRCHRIRPPHRARRQPLPRRQRQRLRQPSRQHPCPRPRPWWDRPRMASGKSP